MSTLILGPTTSGKTTVARARGNRVVELESNWIPENVRVRIAAGEDITVVVNSGLFDEVIVMEKDRV